MRSLRLAGLALVLSCLAGCGLPPRATVVPPFGNYYNNTTAPLDVTFEQNGVGSKTGSAVVHTWFLGFAFGDASVNAAAKNAGITTVDHVDYKAFNILGIYQRYETIVSGR